MPLLYEVNLFTKFLESFALYFMTYCCYFDCQIFYKYFCFDRLCIQSSNAVLTV